MRKSILLRPLALLLVLTAGSPAVRAAEPCPPIEGQFAGANPTFKSGQELPREGTFSLTLQPAGTVEYLVGSHHVRGEAGYGGVVTLARVWGGRYRIFLSSAADIEVIQNYSPLALTECSGEETSYLVSIRDGKVLLQVRGVTDATIGIAFLKL